VAEEGDGWRGVMLVAEEGERKGSSSFALSTWVGGRNKEASGAFSA
jgi:hypothetical protein